MKLLLMCQIRWWWVYKIPPQPNITFLPVFFFSLQAIATGKYHGAVLTNSEEWEVKSLEAGRKSGDLLAPIIYCPELHFPEFASAIADMKNSVAVSRHINIRNVEIDACTFTYTYLRQYTFIHLQTYLCQVKCVFAVWLNTRTIESNAHQSAIRSVLFFKMHPQCTRNKFPTVSYWIKKHYL